MTVTVYSTPADGELVSSLANMEPAVVVLSCEITDGLEAGDVIIVWGDMQATNPQSESSGINVAMDTQLILANNASAAAPVSGSAVRLNYAQGGDITPTTHHGAVTRECSYAVVASTAWSPAYVNLAADARNDALGVGVLALDVDKGYGKITVSRFRND